MQDESQEIVIVSAARTPVGKFQGALSGFSATELGAHRRARSGRARGDRSGQRRRVPDGMRARRGPGPKPRAPSGFARWSRRFRLRHDAQHGVRFGPQSGRARQRNPSPPAMRRSSSPAAWSRCPTRLIFFPHARKGFRMGDSIAVDSMIRDGLWCAMRRRAHGHDRRARRGKVLHHARRAGCVRARVASSRSGSNARRPLRCGNHVRNSAASQQAATRAAPSSFRATRAFATTRSTIQPPHSQRSPRLRPAFKPDGTVTAGNAPGVNDAAAAVVVMSAARAAALGLKPLATIRAQATSGVAPKWVMMAPVERSAEGSRPRRLEHRLGRSVRTQRSLQRAGHRRHARTRRSPPTASTSTEARSPSAIPSEPPARASWSH